ncbi:MAG: hypoxanthine-guanine phosphoribosyltransferase [bacterium]
MNTSYPPEPETLASLLEKSHCLYDRPAIDQALDRLAEEVAHKVAHKHPIGLTVLNGGMVFSGHFVTRLRFSVQLDYIHASRYAGETEGGTLRWIARPSVSLEGRTVLLLDDIYDQGFTMEALRQACIEQGAAEVYSVVLVTKDHQREQVQKRPNFSALTVPDEYVFGFGMDYEHEWRNLDGIYALNP